MRQQLKHIISEGSFFIKMAINNGDDTSTIGKIKNCGKYISAINKKSLHQYIVKSSRQ